MARADVLQLVDDLLLKPEETSDAETFYDDVIRELGFREFLTGTRDQSVEAKDPEYTIGLDTIRVLEAHTRDTGRLNPASGQALRASYGSTWRQRTGSPCHFTRTDESSNVLRLFPVPDCAGTLTIIRTEFRNDLPYWLELPVALEIASRLLIRESANQDLAWASQAKRLANVLFELVGLQLRPIGGSGASEIDEEE